MLILAIDTSHKNGSVCLARGDAQHCEVLGSAQIDGGMFSAQLVPVIAKILKQHNLHKKDLQGIAAAVGPGSFTGLRIGLAAIKGLAGVLRVPIAGVSTLEAVSSLAEGAANKNVLAILDAGRGEYYVGEYSSGDCVNEALLTRDELVVRFKEQQQFTVVISPEDKIAELAAAANMHFQKTIHPQADVIAKLGLKRLACGKALQIDELDANYLRRDEGLFSQKH